MNTAVCTAPTDFAKFRRAVVLVVGLSLSVGLSLGPSPVAKAGISDWFSSSDKTKAKTNTSAKRTVKKAGMFQNDTKKKPSTATGRMLDSVMSSPTKLAGNTMSALLPGKKPATTKSRTVPRKMVSDQKQPSMLGRLFTPQKQEPLTVTEWMAQPRPKP